jgi:hypothetical protein
MKKDMLLEFSLYIYVVVPKNRSINVANNWSLHPHASPAQYRWSTPTSKNTLQYVIYYASHIAVLCLPGVFDLSRLLAETPRQN